MNRPDFQQMIGAIENRQASAVFVKDMSRLGRNYIEVGRLNEEFFPEYDIRLVAVSDNIDTDKEENELILIRNLLMSGILVTLARNSVSVTKSRGTLKSRLDNRRRGI